VTAIQHDAASSARYWPVPVLRAVPFLVMGMIITFVNNHSATIGMTVFGATTVAGGIVLALGSYRWLDDSSSRTIAIVQGIVGIVFGGVALAFISGGLILLVALVTGWAFLAGALELVTGLRRRGRSDLARDWILLGSVTLLLAIAFLLVPTNYSQELGGLEKIKGTLTSSTILVGIVGAYGALVGIFLVIQGLSLKWQTGTPQGLVAEGLPTSGASAAHESSSIDGANTK
jgi:uncharacterized membrane protein HdeD (DUF308 family)